MTDEEPLPFWQVNVPREQRPSECPDFLRECGDKDRGIIGTPDAEYKMVSWDEVRELVSSNRINLFHRKPSDLRRYRQYTYQLVKDYGSIMNFIVNERLQWKTMTPRGRPFECKEDIKVLYNDWPYGLDDKIMHLVIWTKFALEDDIAANDVTPETKKLIDAYVQKTFYPKVKPEHLVWFKNWPSLKSVHAVEHFHVMLYDPDAELMDKLTNGDVPMAAKVSGDRFGVK